jgi:hypothetical protein
VRSPSRAQTQPSPPARLTQSILAGDVWRMSYLARARDTSRKMSDEPTSARLVDGKGCVELPSAQVAVWLNGNCEWLQAFADPHEARATAEQLPEERA